MTKPIYERLREINRRGLLDSMAPDYKIDKRIFRAALLITLLLAFIAAAEAGFQWRAVSFSCPSDGPTCFNPFNPENAPGYLRPSVAAKCPDPDLCRIVKFAPGETWGGHPSFLMEHFGLVVLVLWGGALVYNHVENNQGD